MDFITIGGKSRPVKYGWNAVAEFGKITGLGLDNLGFNKEGEIQVNMQIGDILTLIYVGLKRGARAEKLEVDFTPEDVGDWMDNEDIEKMQEFVDLWVNQMPKQKKAQAP